MVNRISLLKPLTVYSQRLLHVLPAPRALGRLAAARALVACALSEVASPGNVEVITNQLKTNEVFREFRQGDVAMER